MIHGEIVETEEDGAVTGNIIYNLRSYVQQHRSGRVGTEIRHQLLDDDLNSRLPDVSYSTTKRPIVTKGSVPEMVDLVVEVQSPDDTLKKMRGKAAYYLERGSQIVWLVYPNK